MLEFEVEQLIRGDRIYYRQDGGVIRYGIFASISKTRHQVVWGWWGYTPEDAYDRYIRTASRSYISFNRLRLGCLNEITLEDGGKCVLKPVEIPCEHQEQMHQYGWDKVPDGYLKNDFLIIRLGPHDWGIKNSMISPNDLGQRFNNPAAASVWLTRLQELLNI